MVVEEPPRKKLATEGRHPSIWWKMADCSLDEIRKLVDTTTELRDFPFAQRVEKNILIYDRGSLPLDSEEGQRALTSEWAMALDEGPGIFVVKGAFKGEEELRVVDQATEAFNDIIRQAEEAGVALSTGDHFGKKGHNKKIWNSFEKLAVERPEVFVRYFANPIIALVAQAWVGHAYQLGTTVNVVCPGGEAQQSHRDYHLGFPAPDVLERFPAQVHKVVGPMLTLEGLVIHTDQPLETGPTHVMPHSHKYERGYLAIHRPDVREFFLKNSVQLPLQKGDQIYFNPGIFHGAGANKTTDNYRMAHLLQINSTMSRTTDAVDSMRVTEAIYPALLRAINSPGWSEEATARVVAAAAEGYAYPTNYDRDQPLKDWEDMPATQAAAVMWAISKRASPEELHEKLKAQRWRKTYDD